MTTPTKWQKEASPATPALHPLLLDLHHHQHLKFPANHANGHDMLTQALHRHDYLTGLGSTYKYHSKTYDHMSQQSSNANYANYTCGGGMPANHA